MKFVLIEWVDSTSLGGWGDSNDMELCQCETIGFIIKKDKEKIILAQSINNSGEVYNKFAIPKACIKSISSLIKE